MFGKTKHLNECKTFENKLITKKTWNTKEMNRVQIFELKYGNAKLTNVWKYK